MIGPENRRRDMFNRMAKRLEDQFFHERSIALAEQREKLKREEESAEALSKISGITDKKILTELVALDIRPETLAAMCLAPIIEVAWADGKVDEKEIKAVLEAAKGHGLDADHDILQEWLRRRPDPKFMDAWKKYMEGLSKSLNKEVMAVMKANIIRNARDVAEASGRLLGLTNPISAEERKALDGIEAFLKQLKS
jgi:hypothetical protein